MKLYNPERVEQLIMSLEFCPVCLNRATNGCLGHIQQYLAEQKTVDGPVLGYRAFICSCNNHWMEETDDCFSKDLSRCDDCGNVVLPAAHIRWTEPAVPVGMEQVKTGYVCPTDLVWIGHRFNAAADEVGLPVACFRMIVR